MIGAYFGKTNLMFGWGSLGSLKPSERTSVVSVRSGTNRMAPVTLYDVSESAPPRAAFVASKGASKRSPIPSAPGRGPERKV